MSFFCTNFAAQNDYNGILWINFLFLESNKLE